MWYALSIFVMYMSNNKIKLSINKKYYKFLVVTRGNSAYVI